MAVVLERCATTEPLLPYRQGFRGDALLIGVSSGGVVKRSARCLSATQPAAEQAVRLRTSTTAPPPPQLRRARGWVSMTLRPEAGDICIVDVITVRIRFR